MSESKEPISQRLDSSQPDTPEVDRFDTPMWRAIKKGIAGGSLVGFVIAKYIIDTQSVDTLFGAVYEGNVLLLFGVWIGLGAVVGAGIGWLSTRKYNDDDGSSPSSFPPVP